MDKRALQQLLNAHLQPGDLRAWLEQQHPIRVLIAGGMSTCPTAMYLQSCGWQAVMFEVKDGSVRICAPGGERITLFVPLWAWEYEQLLAETRTGITKDEAIALLDEYLQRHPVAA